VKTLSGLPADRDPGIGACFRNAEERGLGPKALVGEGSADQLSRPAICLFLLILTSTVVLPFGVEALAPADKWTATNPAINLMHIDFGEINRYGEAVGYHHRPGGVDPDGAHVLRIMQPPDANGVYRAFVAVRDPVSGAWVRKKAPSTFYPDTMSDPDVVDAVLAAFHSSSTRSDGQFIGPSGRGFVIEGWYQNGRINAAYPLRGP
jgi:Bacterial EndoU nuclease